MPLAPGLRWFHFLFHLEVFSFSLSFLGVTVVVPVGPGWVEK